MLNDETEASSVYCRCIAIYVTHFLFAEISFNERSKLYIINVDISGSYLVHCKLGWIAFICLDTPHPSSENSIHTIQRNWTELKLKLQCEHSLRVHFSISPTSASGSQCTKVIWEIRPWGVFKPTYTSFFFFYIVTISSIVTFTLAQPHSHTSRTRAIRWYISLSSAKKDREGESDGGGQDQTLSVCERANLIGNYSQIRCISICSIWVWGKSRRLFDLRRFRGDPYDPENINHVINLNQTADATSCLT